MICLFVESVPETSSYIVSASFYVEYGYLFKTS